MGRMKTTLVAFAATLALAFSDAAAARVKTFYRAMM